MSEDLVKCLIMLDLYADGGILLDPPSIKTLKPDRPIGAHAKKTIGTNELIVLKDLKADRPEGPSDQ